ASLLFSLRLVPARPHLTIREIYNSERASLLCQKKRGAAGSPFHIIRMRAEKQDVQVHLPTIVYVRKPPPYFADRRFRARSPRIRRATLHRQTGVHAQSGASHRNVRAPSASGTRARAHATAQTRCSASYRRQSALLFQWRTLGAKRTLLLAFDSGQRRVLL